MYCQHCGNPVAEPEADLAEAAEAAAGAQADAADSLSTAEVEIARIQAERDITLAKIERGIVGDMAEASAAEDAVKADLLDQVLEPEPAAAAEPVIVEAEPEPEPEPEGEPPVLDTAAAEPAAKRSGNPWW